MKENQASANIRRIRALDVETVRKIAAGEVIERPVNVVKELVENSIDAGATEIIVELEKGGKALIRVRDDGIGMSAEDLEVAWQRHTTSKISSIQDLNVLSTLGFRGEALHSIASVSRLRIISRYRGTAMGHELRVEAAKFLGLKPVACPEGTIVEVRDLFFNFPVRKKFLRDESIELAKVHDFLQNFSLGYPQKKFVLKHEGKLLFLSPRERGHKESILRVHGKRFTQSLIEVKTASDSWELEAYLMLPRTRRNKKKYILTFVNGRLVSSDLITRAVKEGFKEFLVKGDQPIAMLFLRAPSSEFDINIHPSKKEIAFANPTTVYELLKTSIEQGLHDAQSSLASKEDARKVEASLSPAFASRNVTDESITKERGSSFTSGREGRDHERAGFSSTRPRGRQEKMMVRVSSKQELLLPSIPSSALELVDHALKEEDTVSMQGKSIRIIGQLASSYLLLEDETTNDLIIADQHALDERRRLKLLKARAREEMLKAEWLLAPLRISPLPEERAMLSKYSSHLKQVGITLREDPRSSDDLLIESLPRIISSTSLSYEDLCTLLLELCEVIEKEPRGDPRAWIVQVQDHLLKTMACKGAIKFGKRLTNPEIKVLLESIEDLQVPFICAHGRPSVLILPMTKLHALFRRKG